ncbi:MAG: ABC transporter permease [Magnetococcales bacterium]|nr:ABC transporter permease [Magnetococcales bacterium]
MMRLMLAEAWQSMEANRMRTFLTMLGMVIGVGAVVLMMAVGQGAEEGVRRSISTMGSHLFIILSGSSTTGGVRMGSGSVTTLTASDAEAIGQLPGVEHAAPVYQGSAQVVHGPNNWSVTVYGVTPDYLPARAWELAEGRPITDSDVRSATRVALLGRTTAANLFGEEEAVGRTIRIKQSPFVVAGVLAPKGQSLDGRDQDDTILVPLTTAQRKLFGAPFPGAVRMIMAQAASGDLMPALEREINELLRQRHRLRSGQDNDFTVRNLTAVAQSAAEMTRIMSMLLGAIASVSLVVGGIGIMNIMLVSVTERTREIGLRMALGARERDVLLQFLLEAVIISLSGCVLGVGLGVGGAWLVSRITEMATVVTLSSVGLSLAVAAGVGLFFGLWPARKAARLDPIEALRHA